ncbi:MAG: DeoR/GlpR transcriptional regulator [Desulfobacter sp.]|nr:MAG: DeoR/GlpR transcriptional regulator [Desulfobacter sp.]
MTQRQNGIVQLVRENGFATVEEMARQFKVTPQTIRRDINTLNKEGRITRHHGGAAASGSTENLAYTRRKKLLQAEKKDIARAAAALVPDNSSLFINIGTTTEQVARALAHRRRLKVITNNLNIAAIMGSNEDFQVLVSGGIVRARDNGITGDSAIRFIRRFKADIGIIGISGIDGDGTLLDYDFMEVDVARAIMDNAGKVILVADHSKFNRSAMVKLGNIAEIHTLVTDREPPPTVTAVMKKSGVNLVLTG